MCGVVVVGVCCLFFFSLCVFSFFSLGFLFCVFRIIFSKKK